MNIQDLIKQMQTGVATVVFEKIDTKEIRVMPCTLNEEVAQVPMTIKNYDAKSTSLVMWALDKKAWRDVRVNTIKEWYNGYPEGG
jgi:hypothetical protein|tara:strand:+ start:8211 stop:8465 length:255 start_codon:yes stop_codon:yes gene_type:complete